MIYNLESNIDKEKFKIKTAFVMSNNKVVQFVVKNEKNEEQLRTELQNNSMHLYFKLISDQLNELGLDFIYTGLKGKELSMIHTPYIVKEFVWRPIQIAMFDIESTTKINTKQINDILDVLTVYFGDKGIVIEFPSLESLENKNK
jgi:hypothetical protein